LLYDCENYTAERTQTGDIESRAPGANCGGGTENLRKVIIYFSQTMEYIRVVKQRKLS
jgi:hypothetical protein